MRFLWKILLVVIPLGSYWLYKKDSSKSRESEKKSPQAESETASPQEQQESASQNRGKKKVSKSEIIEQLANIDGVTRRVAENLIESGIESKEALLKLSEEELKSIKGIGPKRAAKILNLR